MSVFDTKKSETRDFLLKYQIKNKKAKGSWPGMHIDSEPSFWACSQILWALLESGSQANDSPIKMGLNYLLRCRNKNYAWPEEDAGTRDATFKTATALLALNSSQLPTKRIREALKKGIERLVHLKIEDEGWGYIEGDKSYVRPSAVAVLALSTIYSAHPNLQADIKESLKNGVKWLEDAQNEDFGWGILPGDNQSNLITGWVVWTLSTAKGLVPVNDTKISNGISWLIGNQNTHGFWIPKEEMARVVGQYTIPPIYGVGTPLGVLALLSACEAGFQTSASCDCILRSMYWLLRREEENKRYWVQPLESGGYIRVNDASEAEEKRQIARPVTWATAYYLLALSRFEKLHAIKLGCFFDVCLRNFRKVAILEGLPI